MTFLDTGEDYEDGHAEELLGKAIQGIREKVFISSKFKPSNNSFAGVLGAIEGSLRRLKADYIDLYQIHWPNLSIPVSETMVALSVLVEKGKTRFVGVCNFTLSQLKEAQGAFPQGRIVSVQTEYNLNNRLIEYDLLPYCQDNKITVIAYNLFSQGNLYLSETERDTVKAIAEKYGASVSQVIINWVISKAQVIALINTMSFDHLKENVGATAFELAGEDIDTIDLAFDRKPVMIPTDRIRVVNRDADETHTIYTTLNEAIKNTAGVHPSPLDLAEEIKRGNLLRPVEVVPSQDTSGSYDYDLIHGRNRYWAWIIAHGYEVPIPAYVAGGTRYSG
jgi:diketogulonate reductase-like aldo/keto reductase